jgi:hypothetical protein
MEFRENHNIIKRGIVLEIFRCMSWKKGIFIPDGEFMNFLTEMESYCCMSWAWPSLCSSFWKLNQPWLIPTTPFAVNEEIFHQNLSFNPNYGRNDHSLIETPVPLNNIPATKVRKCFSKFLIFYYYFNVFI